MLYCTSFVQYLTGTNGRDTLKLTRLALIMNSVLTYGFTARYDN